MRYITYIRTTFQGAYEIHGIAGTMQFMGYSKREAIRKYNQLAKIQRRQK